MFRPRNSAFPRNPWAGQPHFAYRFGIEKIPVYLAVKVFAVGDNDKGIIAGELMENLPGQENHGKAFA